MAALTAPRTVARLGSLAGYPERFPGIPMKASTTIFAGAPVCVDTATGYATNAAVSTTLITVGLAQETWENQASPDQYYQPGFTGSGVAGNLLIEAEPGVYEFNNSASADLIAWTNYGSDCYWVDNQTVGLTSGSSTRSVAGTIVGINPVSGLVQVMLGINFK